MAFEKGNITKTVLYIYHFGYVTFFYANLLIYNNLIQVDICFGFTLQ